MRKLALLTVCVVLAGWCVGSARAEYPLLGTIVVTDGGTASNRTTGYAAYACGGCFTLNSLDKITVQTDEGCYVCNGLAGCDAGTGVYIAANEKYSDAMNANSTQTGKAYNSDGGTAGVSVTYTGGWYSVAPPLGGSSCHAKFRLRSGKE